MQLIFVILRSVKYFFFPNWNVEIFPAKKTTKCGFCLCMSYGKFVCVFFMGILTMHILREIGTPMYFLWEFSPYISYGEWAHEFFS